MLKFIKRKLGITTLQTVINDLITENAALKRRIQIVDESNHRMENYVGGMQNQIDEKLKEFQSLHAMDADESYRGQCTIILTGVFRGRGYVKFVDVEHDEFRHMVERFRSRKSMFRNEDRPQHYTGGSFLL
jgi:hypothetical protein